MNVLEASPITAFARNARETQALGLSEGIVQAISRAGKIYEDKSLSSRDRWEQIASVAPDIGPVFIKLVQTVIPLVRLKKERTPEEEDMLHAFAGIHTKFGKVNAEKSGQALAQVPSVMTGRLRVDQDKLLGSASISEVYEGEALQMRGRQLAVKLQKPGAAEEFKQTFVLLRSGLAMAGDKPLAKAFLTMTEDAYAEEFDTGQEMENLQTLRRIGIKAPKVYPELSSETTIVMDKVEGVPLVDFVKTADHKARKKVAGRYVASLVKMVRNGVLHGDPHGGNVLVDKKGKLTWLDASPLIPFSAKEAFRMGMLVWHMRSGNGSKLIDTLNLLTDNKKETSELTQIKQETHGMKGFDLLKAVFAKGLLLPKRDMVLARALAEGVGTAMEMLPEAKGVGSWMGILLRGAMKSVF